MTTVHLRRLALADLAAIETIERASYPTPWSRSMFAGELAKSSSICLGAFDTDGDERHLPRARFHAELVGELGPVEAIEPLYLRVPDAERSAR